MLLSFLWIPLLCRWGTYWMGLHVAQGSGSTLTGFNHTPDSTLWPWPSLYRYPKSMRRRIPHRVPLPTSPQPPGGWVLFLLDLWWSWGSSCEQTPYWFCHEVYGKFCWVGYINTVQRQTHGGAGSLARSERAWKFCTPPHMSCPMCLFIRLFFVSFIISLMLNW